MILLKILVSGALIVWIVRRADLASVWAALSQASSEWIGLALALQFLGAGIIAVRWRGLLSAKGVDPGFAYLFRSMLAAAFFRQFLPSIIGGDAIRGYDAWRAGATPGLSAISLLIDRLLGLTALALFVLIAIGLSDELSNRVPQAGLWVSAGMAGLLAVLVIMLRGRSETPKRLDQPSVRPPSILRGKLTAINDAMSAYRGEHRIISRAFALSVLLQINVVTSYWALGKSLGLGLNYPDFYVFVPLAVFVMMAPITINGVGLREAAFIFLLSAWSIPEPAALAFAWLEYASFLAFGLIGGVVYSLRPR